MIGGKEESHGYKPNWTETFKPLAKFGETCHLVRAKKRAHLKGKVEEVEANSHTKNIQALFAGINGDRKGFQARVNVIKDESGDLVADPTGGLERWKEYFTKLFNVHEESEQRSDSYG